MSVEHGAVTQLGVSGAVKNGTGKILGFFISSGTPTVKLWDNTAASGTVLLESVITTAATYYPFPASFSKGCYATITNAGEISFITS